MIRAELERLSLAELYRLAAERGLREAPGLPREEVIARLADDRPPSETHGRHRHDRKPPHADREHHGGDARHEAARPPSSTSGPAQPRPRTRGAGIPSAMARDRPSEHDPEDMGRLYLEQGEYERAIEIFRELLSVRPDDESLAAALAAAEGKLRERLPYSPGVVEIEPPLPRSPTSEPTSMLDLEEPPEWYGIDECEVIAQTPHYLFVYWEVTERGMEAARADLGDDARDSHLVLRVFATPGPGERGPDREFRDHAVDWNHGRRYIQAPRAGARVRAAVGLRTSSGLFAPIAQSSQIRVPPESPSPALANEWMHVEPDRTRGLERGPIRIVHRGPEGAERGPATHLTNGAPGHAHGASSSSRPPGHSGSSWRWRPGSQS